MPKYLLIFLFPLLTRAQSASVEFTIQHGHANSIFITKGDYTRAARLFGKEDPVELPLKTGIVQWRSQLKSPIWLTAEAEDSTTGQSYSYLIYLTPGDQLRLSFDFGNPDSGWTVKGKGSINNQPALQKILNRELDLSVFRKDSLPEAVFRAIQERTTEKQQLLDQYFKQGQWSGRFRQICGLYVQYYPVWTFLRFKGEQRFSARSAYTRNEAAWQAIEDSLLRARPLNQELLMPIDEYAFFLSIYLIRIKERVWQHPELFREYYGATTQEEALQLHQDDPENFLKERIIQKHFSGRTAEYLYGLLFHQALQEKEDNLPEIYDRFRKLYPHSGYIPHIQPAITSIMEHRKRQLSGNMVFIEHPEAYQSFDDILQLVKGKTVLLDMWGTWCGPCRAELAKHADALHQQFKDQPLTFLYIANYDTGQESKWKELIAYYGLTGMHLLASKQLTKDIMDKVKGEGFPTNVIINKDGTFELSKAGYPLNREKLVAQLEAALKE